jgi:hypothetical protein
LTWKHPVRSHGYTQRYNGLPGEDDQCDGARLASHLAVAPMNLSASDTGKAYFEAESRHPFKSAAQMFAKLATAIKEAKGD